MGFLRCYGVPIVMACVAAGQAFAVQWGGLCSWRGGGFGMYASFHPRQHEVWLERLSTGEMERFAKYDGYSGEVFEAVRPCLTWPSQATAEAAWNDLPETVRSDARVRVYRLAFDPSSGELSRALLAEAPAVEGPTE